MSEMRIEVEGLAPLLAQMAAGNRMIEREFSEEMEGATADLKAEEQRRVPRDRGLLHDSFITEVRSSPVQIRGIVDIRGPAAQYGGVVDAGRRAGAAPPPVAPIAAWLRRKGSDASPYVVARAIGRRGIKARPFREPALRAQRQAIINRFERAVERIARKLAGKR